MTLKRIVYSLFIILIPVLWSGCAYELSDENILNVKEPPGSVRIDLMLLKTDDTIKIVEKQLIEYSVNTYGLKLQMVEFKLGSYFKWDIPETSGSFTIDPATLSTGLYELTMDVYTNSGTGSLADKTGHEGFLAKRSWKVKIIRKTTGGTDGGTTTPVDSTIDNSPAIPIKNIKTEITPDGYLKFSWNKVLRKDFYAYRIYWSVGYTDIMRYKASDTTYIDSTYVGGAASFRVDYSRHHDNMDVYGQYLALNEPYPTISVTGIRLDSVKVHWPKSKYRARYEVLDDRQAVAFKSTTDTSFTVAAPGFGSGVSFTLYVIPKCKATLDFEYFKSNIKSYSLGKYILPNWPLFACNPTEKKVYAVHYDAIDCYSLPDMALYKTMPVKNMMHQGLFACPTNSSKVAALSSDNIYVYNDQSLTNPVIIPFPCYAKTINYLCLTDNDLVGVASSTEYDLIRVTDKTLVASIPIPDSPYYSPWSCNSASSDGKYFVVSTMNGIHLYKIENTLVMEVYTDKRAYYSVLFDPGHPERFYVTLAKSNVIEMRSSADFSLIKSYILPGNYHMLQNIDPETGLLLLTNYTSNYLYDLQNEKIVFTMVNNSNDYNPRFYYGTMFSNNGRYLNISNYITR